MTREPFEDEEEPSLMERAWRRSMTRQERALAAFDFYTWLQQQEGLEHVVRRFIESGLLDERKP